MKNKVPKLILVTVALIAVGLLAWYFLSGGYHPKAYMVISDIHYGEGNLKHRVYEINTYAIEVDLQSHRLDTFPIDVRVPAGLMVDHSGKELYVTGREGMWSEYNVNNESRWSQKNQPQFQDIHVYDVNTGHLQRKLELPPEAEGSVHAMTLTPDGSRMFIKNPYKEEENAPTGEKQKKYWTIDPETGEFLFGFDVGYGTYMTSDGSKSYMFRGQKDSVLGPGFMSFNVVEDKVIKGYRGLDELMEEQGGLHIEGFEFGYPHMEGNRPLKFYDRDTYEEIGRLDLTRNMGSDEQLSISLPQEDMITGDKKYLVVKVTKELEGYKRQAHYLRLVDIQNREIEDTIKIWQGSGRTRGPVIH